MPNTPLFTVAICTYNRAHLLEDCLNALSLASPVAVPWELLVVDNNSQDSTKEVVLNFSALNPSMIINYSLALQQGLSHARNHAIVASKAYWIMYLDDDAKVREDFLQRTVYLVKKTDYQIVGGVYYPWYKYGRPKWFKDRYASNAKPIRNLSVPRGEVFASGGVMLWEKKLLKQLGGFNVNIGMKGNKVAYGEETIVQQQAKNMGIDIAYDPNLVIYHVVAEQKLTIDWFFVSNFAKGRDQVLGGEIKPSRINLVLQLVIGLSVMTKDLLLNTLKLFFQTDYYLENWLIDTFRKMAKRIGVIYTGLKKIMQSNK